MRQLIFVAVFVLSLFSPAHAQTAEERPRLEWALHRGQLLFAIDRAAWITTDDVRERVGDFGRAGVRGWTVERDGSGYIVTYFTGQGDTRAALYRARVENNRIVSRELFAEGARPPLTALQRRLADARAVLARMDLRACARSVNLAVIPPGAPDAPLDFYALTPQTRTGVYPFGGHHRVTVSSSGEVLSQRAFTNSCLEMSGQPEGEGRPVGLGITHLLDPIPTEIHVFLAIWIGLPVYVSAGDRVWEVTGSAIRFVDNIEERPGT